MPVVSVEDGVSPPAEEQVIEEELVSECREQAQMNDPDVFKELPELECITPEDMSEISFSLPPACSIAEKHYFVEKHPYQPTRSECADLPFQEADFYYRKKSNGDRIKHSWLSCKIKDRKLEAFFCSICIAFSNSSSSFTRGCSNFQHCYQAYDVPLKNHLDKCVQDSEKRKQRLKDRKTSGKHSTGRGSLVTFLPNNTIKKVFAAIVRSMKNLIVSEIGEKRFSIQVHSTQDVGIVDQATVVARYVQDEAIKERLVAILPVKDATGKGFHELLMSCFDVLGLDFQKIASESFDGAANMRSAYVGLRAQIAKVVPDGVYIWCYSHILNLSCIGSKIFL
ncbi:zinc finger MYM-type 1-like [Pelobates cultripes]|uniref:Zinc finger MYM-type 1-like n=1 Tax=Pelobates cultripes TaxID=61616 RepID=A0AAD1VY39_PELCU|nr:zinc finger MYM-type 1-like [Pelobates cultripes]